MGGLLALAGITLRRKRRTARTTEYQPRMESREAGRSDAKNFAPAAERASPMLTKSSSVRWGTPGTYKPEHIRSFRVLPSTSSATPASAQSPHDDQPSTTHTSSLRAPFQISKSSVSSENQSSITCSSSTVITFAGAAFAGTTKPADEDKREATPEEHDCRDKSGDDCSWRSGKYKGEGTGYDDGSWRPGKYEGKGTGYDDGSWWPGKYEGEGTGYDDGSWWPGKYEGKGTGYDDGKWSPEKYS